MLSATALLIGAFKAVAAKDRILNRDDRVLVGDLAKQFRTSQVTIRKDLDILQAMENQSECCMGVRPNMIGGILW